MLVINHDQEKDWIFVVNEKEKNKKEKSAVSRLRNPVCFEYHTKRDLLIE